ncbi:MAG: hypothetical protein HYY17_11615 [Planctomycetes bacterium]|nr:hypothetical protein [Planctomycetota bacterium]
MRRSLSNLGGRPRPWGDTALARILARCFAVEPIENPPLTHGFHAYPGRMHPQIAERVLAAFPPKTRVLDPFMGSGTVAVESLRAGAPFLGIDVSRVAIEVAWTRTRVLPPAECRRVEAAGLRIERTARENVDENLPVPKWAEAHANWYDPRTLGEIGLLKALVDEERDGTLRRLLTCVLSSLLVKLSRQASDSVTVPDESRRPWPPRAAFRLFREKCAELTKRLLLLSSDLHKRGVKPPEPEFRVADARELKLPAGTADLVFTSPPYAGTYDYSAHHTLRFALYGQHDFAEAREIGARRDRAENYRRDLERCLSRLLAALAPGGRIVLLIGDGSVQGARVEADRLVRDLARSLGARVPAGASRDLTEWAHGKRGERRREHLIGVSR